MEIKESHVQFWKEKVYEKENEIDPGQEEDWRSMALGFALALDYTPDEAEKFVNEIGSQGLL
jgi:hypothetical protein